MAENILTQLQELRTLYAEAMPTDHKVIEQYAWIICKSINRHAEELGALACRQLLADLMRMPLPRPSMLYSSVLWSATKVASLYADFHFVPFLNLWNPTLHLRPEDFERGKSTGHEGEEGNAQQANGQDIRTFPSLAERMVRGCMEAQLIRPEEKPNFMLKDWYGFHAIEPMVVTKVSQSEVKGRKMYFAQLTSQSGIEVVTEAHTLRTNPLTPSEGRHYANVGQLYNVLLRDKQDGSDMRVVDAVLSAHPLSAVFPVQTGYVEHIDHEHEHVHIFDSQSRHFVSSGQRFLKVNEGQFVSFVPIVPLKSKFKSAIVVPPAVPAGTPATAIQEALISSFPPREIRITFINKEKQYVAWELVDASQPITEQLSALQLSQGETSPSFDKGYINMSEALSMVLDLSVGQVLKAIIYLRRGKDKAKRPHVAKLIR